LAASIVDSLLNREDSKRAIQLPPVVNGPRLAMECRVCLFVLRRGTKSHLKIRFATAGRAASLQLVRSLSLYCAPLSQESGEGKTFESCGLLTSAVCSLPSGQTHKMSEKRADDPFLDVRAGVISTCNARQGSGEWIPITPF